MVKTRFAPSPTGYLHIGGARTALFNWLYAKGQKGQFVLRVEDTDLVRSDKKYVAEILESMEWLGLKWDEIYYQSDRFDLYREYAEKLLEEKKAYRDGEAIILSIPQDEVKIYDIIRGEIIFDTETIKDQVLMKSDGSPTYSFACVVDDALMEITHVIRGEDHISNTPKQIMIYKALELKIPKFAHLPLIMGEDGGRLSKRTGAVAVSDYQKEGFLPEALVNYLLLLGWAPGNNQEKIEIEKAIEKFSIKKVNKAAAVFSMDKLKWLNSEYVKNLKPKDLVELIIPFMDEEGYNYKDRSFADLEKIVSLYQKRLPTLKDFIGRAGYIFDEGYQVADEVRREYLKEDRSKEFKLLSERLKGVDSFDSQETEKVFRALVDEIGLKSSDLVHPVRVALTGSAVGPGLFETMEILGKEKTISRLLEAFNK